MGKRAERKQRRLDKTDAYKKQMHESFFAEMDKVAGAVPTQSEVDDMQRAHRYKAARMAAECPQEKEIIFTAYQLFIEEICNLADNLRNQGDSDEPLPDWEAEETNDE